MKKHLFVNLLIMAITTLLCLVIAEIGLRFYGIVPTTDRLYAYQFDDVLGWRTRPSFKYYRSSLEFAHFSYYNSQGFPTTKEDWNKRLDPQKPSIAFIGDSFTEGYYLPYEFTFTYLLRQKMGQQVVNLGVSGYAPDQFLLAARKYLPQYNVQTIIVMFFPYNDISDIFRDAYQGYAKPLFTNTLEQPVNLPLKQLTGKPQDENLLQKIAHVSALYAMIRPLVRKYFEHPVLQNSIMYEPAQMRKALTLIQRIHLDFPTPRFLVYYIPMYNEITQQTLPENMKTFHSLCAELNIECTGMDTIVQKVAQPAAYYQIRDGHFSKAGAAAVADQLYAMLSSPQ